MKKLKNILDYQTQIAIIVVGISLIIFGIYFFFEIISYEETNQVIQMNRMLRIIYDFGGKYCILVFFEILGIVTLFFGVKQLRELKSNEDETL